MIDGRSRVDIRRIYGAPAGSKAMHHGVAMYNRILSPSP